MISKSLRVWITCANRKKRRAPTRRISSNLPFTPCLASDIQTGVQLFTKPKGPIAVMGMGPMGPVSRLLYSQLGSCLVYGYLGEEETAPGQWHVSLIKETLRRLGPILR